MAGLCLALALAAPASARVLRVGPRHGHPGHAQAQFRTIQAAVDAARPGDWILVAPGDYHERGDFSGAARRRRTRPGPGS